MSRTCSEIGRTDQLHVKLLQIAEIDPLRLLTLIQAILTCEKTLKTISDQKASTHTSSNHHCKINTLYKDSLSTMFEFLNDRSLSLSTQNSPLCTYFPPETSPVGSPCTKMCPSFGPVMSGNSPSISYIIPPLNQSPS